MEHKIRDWLADNLSFIEKDLKLIDKEFYLPDDIGANGFIDLLCTDIYNNYVIIEIKRSDTSARQTINEVLKYYSLIKSNFRARESEIRIIIISTHWNELIRPYSEVHYKTNIAIKGYKIEIDNTGIPYSNIFVEPISDEIISRKFAYWQGFYLFRSTEKRDIFLGLLKQRVSILPLNDFVILNLNGPVENKKIITPYSIIIAFQRQTINDLLEGIRILAASKTIDVMDESDFNNEVIYQRHLEDAFIAALEMYKYDDDTEAGYPEKLDGMLTDQGWTIQRIERFGIFKKDPRYNDELLIKELRGHDGSNQNKYVGFAESTQKDRIKEIQQECLNSLDNAPQWFEFIEWLFKKLEKSNSKFRILIDVYTPDSIVTAFYFTIIKGNPAYLPQYYIFIDYLDSNKIEIYKGDIYWNQKKPTAKLFTSNNANDIANEVFRLQIDPNNFVDSIKMALVYNNEQIIIENNKELFNGFVLVDFDNDLLKVNKIAYKSIEEYIVYNQAIIQKMVYNYSSVSASL